jgi:hypothetical protein
MLGFYFCEVKYTGLLSILNLITEVVNRRDYDNMYVYWNSDGSVGIVTRLRPSRQTSGFWIPGGDRRYYLFYKRSRRALGFTQSPVKLVPEEGEGGLLHRRKSGAGSEAHLTPPSSAVVKNAWNYAFTASCLNMITCYSSVKSAVLKAYYLSNKVFKT